MHAPGKQSVCHSAPVDLVFEKDVYDEPGVYFCSVCDQPCHVITEPKQAFHDHLDICQQCREHPFALCPTGHALFFAAVRNIQEQSVCQTQNHHQPN